MADKSDPLLLKTFQQEHQVLEKTQKKRLIKKDEFLIVKERNTEVNKTRRD
jgi:hypothetical protein